VAGEHVRGSRFLGVAEVRRRVYVTDRGGDVVGHSRWG
jgi:hypothetical protein